MKKFFNSNIIITTGLAIFSMFFGAGNLMFPIKVGVHAGQYNVWAMAGFLLTAVCLPVAGLIGIMLFDGDYEAFFNRVGKIPGFLLILFCMIIIGPLIAMPRIVTLSHIMIAPFIGNISLPLFTILFLVLTFLGTYRESKIIDLLGYIISPALLVSLIIILIKGFFSAETALQAHQAPTTLFWQSLKVGYNTLDILASIFFSSIILTILKQNLDAKDENDTHKLALMGLQAGLIGTTLLGLVYFGMSFLGVYFGHNLEHINPGQIFSAISFRVLGGNGAIIIAIAVLMACFSTIIALAAVVAEYLDREILPGRVNYVTALIIALVATGITSNFGLDQILKFSAPIIEIGYPVIIVLTFLNIAYKVFGFKPVKIPVLVTLLFSIMNYFWL